MAKDAEQMTLLLACLAVSVTIPRPVADPDWTLLRAIVSAENSPGPNPSQLSEAARHDNRTPLGHLKWIKRTLVKRGMVPTPYLVALCWNSGCTTVFERRELARHRDFAERARNIYEVNAK